MKKSQRMRLFGIFGHPLSHTLSPQMHEEAFRHSRIPASYLVFDFSVQALRKTLKGPGPVLLSGFNVTVPYKQAVLPYCDSLTEQAKRVGAVNTVFRKGKRWIGTNTDVDGFIRSLKEEGRFRAKGCTVLVIGAGGSSRAVIYGLARAGACRIIISNRSLGRALQIKKDFQRVFKKSKFEVIEQEDRALKEALVKASLIINATSVGLKKKDKALLSPSWIPKALPGKRKLFFDLIYKPAVTKFLAAAKKKGHATLNGEGMLVYQGAGAFELWTGRRAPVAVMRRALSDT